MNTIGKILVILNFLFAIIVGGLLLMDFATRTQWRAAYQSLEGEFKVLKAARDTHAAMSGTIETRLKQKEMELQTVVQKLKDAENAGAAEKTSGELQAAELKTKLKDADLTLAKLTSETERLKTEVKDREKTITDREKAIIALEDNLKKYRREAIANENLARTVQARNEQLMVELQEKVAQLRKLEAGGGASGEPVVRNSKDPNPPTARVRGQIERVDPVSGAVALSVGSDQGLKEGHTLWAYRLRPEPKYLGMIRIREVEPHRAVGQLVRTGGVGTRQQLREGDLVASELK